MNRKSAAVGLLLAAVFMCCGILAYTQLSKKKVDLRAFHGTVLAEPRAIMPFALQATNGQAFNNTSLRGHWTFLFFGFTHCASVCPLTMAKLAGVVRLLGVVPPQVVMISLDPERDTLNRLQQYVTAFHPDFLGVRGSLPEVKALAQSMGIASMVMHDRHQPQSYNIEHSGTIMLINPQGQLLAFFTPPHHARLIAEDYQLLQML